MRKFYGSAGMDFSSLKTSDLFVVMATLIGPILAVQAQKAVERLSEARERKLKTFYALMSTRVSRLSPEHVQALNSIPLVFGNSRFFFLRRTSPAERKVLEGWDLYQDVLNVRISDLNESQFANWVGRRDDLFNSLLLLMSQSLGFKFNQIQIAKGVYSPMAQATLEQNQQAILNGLAKTFRDGTPIPMSIEKVAVDASAAELQQNIQNLILEALHTEGIPVKIFRSDDSKDLNNGR